MFLTITSCIATPISSNPPWRQTRRGKGRNMRYLKMLGLATVVATAFAVVSGAGSASATVFCSTTADPCPEAQHWPTNTVVDWSIPSGGSTVLVDTTGEELDTCSSSTKKGKITNTGSSTTTVGGPLEELTWGGCTFPTKTLTKGGWEVHKIGGTSSGTMTASGTSEVTINTIFFGSCIYGVTAGVSLGDVTEGQPAILHTNAVTEKFSGSALACPSTAKWTGTYTLTQPVGTTLSVAAS